jgi:hypothetical protein
MKQKSRYFVTFILFGVLFSGWEFTGDPLRSIICAVCILVLAVLSFGRALRTVNPEKPESHEKSSNGIFNWGKSPN